MLSTVHIYGYRQFLQYYAVRQFQTTPKSKMLLGTSYVVPHYEHIHSFSYQMSFKVAFTSLLTLIHTPSAVAFAIRAQSSTSSMSSKRIIPIDIISDTI